MDTAKLRQLSGSGFGENGEAVPFRKQIEDYAYGRMPSGDMFVVSTDSLSLPVPSPLPILMKQSTVKKVTIAHDLSLSEIERLPNWIAEHPLALESLTELNSIVVVTSAKDKFGREIVVALHLEKELRQVMVNEIASMYGKRNLSYLVENTLAAGRKVYVNERTSDWLQHAGVPFPERTANRLREYCNTI